jgi:hypothetical protein
MIEFFIGMLTGLALGVTIGAYVAYETTDKRSDH